MSLHYLVNFIKINILKSLIFINNNYTYLSIMIISLFSAIIIYLHEFLLKYNNPYWWNWKQYAFFKTLRLIIFLILIKEGLRILL